MLPQQHQQQQQHQSNYQPTTGNNSELRTEPATTTKAMAVVACNSQQFLI